MSALSAYLIAHPHSGVEEAVLDLFGSAVNGATINTISQVTATTTSGPLFPARPTRKSVTIFNADATIKIYYGQGTVTALNGMLLNPGSSVSKTFTGAINVLAASGTPTVIIDDEYN